VTHPIAFALSVLALLVVPGPTNTLLAGAGATRGVRRSLALLVGELAGYNITVAVMRQTLGAVANETSGAQLFLKCAVVAYLVFLAIRLWRAPLTAGASGFTLRRVFVTTLLNPKGLIFSLFIFPPPPTPIAAYFLAFSAMVVAIGATWVVAGSLIAQFTKPSFSVIVPRICACAMAAFAIVVVSGLSSH
jgi:threonine/homoserine/homoserine lactone efflux protein